MEREERKKRADREELMKKVKESDRKNEREREEKNAEGGMGEFLLCGVRWNMKLYLNLFDKIHNRGNFFSFLFPLHNQHLTKYSTMLEKRNSQIVSHKQFVKKWQKEIDFIENLAKRASY